MKMKFQLKVLKLLFDKSIFQGIDYEDYARDVLEFTKSKITRHK